MKTMNLKNGLVVLGVAGLALLASNAIAQDSTAPAPALVTPAVASASAPQLAYGVPQILQLAQAKVGDDTIIAYIKNSGNSYGLDANQIIYMRQQGVSDAVITTMLNQPKPAVAAAAPISMPTTPAPQVASTVPSVEQVSTATVAPTVTYVQTVPMTYYYPQPYYYPAFGYYGWYPGVSVSLGWGGRWGGGGWRGGGGWHR